MMRNIPNVLSALVLSTTLFACGTGNDRNNQGTSSQGMNQGTHGNTARTGTGTHMGQQGKHMVSMSCLNNMDQSGWRDMGLNNDQISRVQQLQQRTRTQGGMGTQGTQGNTATDNTRTMDSQGNDAGGRTGGTQGTGNTLGSTQGSTGSGTANDQSTQRDLSDILTDDQMAALGRKCDDDKNRMR